MAIRDYGMAKRADPRGKKTEGGTVRYIIWSKTSLSTWKLTKHFKNFVHAYAASTARITVVCEIFYVF